MRANLIPPGAVLLLVRVLVAGVSSESDCEGRLTLRQSTVPVCRHHFQGVIELDGEDQIMNVLARRETGFE